MNREIKILALADYSEEFECGGCRATLIVNRGVEEYPAMFGFVELSGDYEDARIVFEAMERRARELGFTSLIGPMNYCTWMSYRWAIDNYDFKLFPDCTNPPHYNEWIGKLGYRELYTYRSAVIDMDNPLFEAGRAVYKEKLREGYRFETYEGEEAFRVAREVYEISKDAFRDAYLYSDLPYEVFEELYLSWIGSLKFSLIVAYDGEAAAGYVFGYENPVGEGFISKTSAVRKRFQKHGLYVALLYLGCLLVKEKGYGEMIYHFQCEQKEGFRRFEKGIESREKRYAIYHKEL